MVLSVRKKRPPPQTGKHLLGKKEGFLRKIQGLRILVAAGTEEGKSGLAEAKE